MAGHSKYFLMAVFLPVVKYSTRELLGSTFISIVINDLPYIVKNTDGVMYADDCTLFCALLTSVELCANLQVQLQNITKWVRVNKLVLKSIVFGSRTALANATAPYLSIDGLSVEQVNQTKLLGVKLDNVLSWSDQIVSKMGKGIAMSRKCCAYVPSSAMLYGHLFYHTCSTALLFGEVLL